MKNRIREACFSFLALFLLACGFSAALFIGMLLMPFAFLIVLVLAVREIINWKRNKKLTKEKNKVMSTVVVQRKSNAIVRHMPILKNNERVA